RRGPGARCGAGGRCRGPAWSRVVRGERMWFIEAVGLGLVQALTECRPVASSAHVRVVGELMDPGQDPGAAFTAIIQLGTETAVLIYFWDDISRIIEIGRASCRERR